ncbi:hypothetical protein BSNT_08208 [Bacillus subtilis subsp. natto BEST195]|nr:hypothetical protein BSNT_08208 [Bacillus subtilis subsp. natto BEST195]
MIKILLFLTTFLGLYSSNKTCAKWNLFWEEK